MMCLFPYLLPTSNLYQAGGPKRNLLVSGLIRRINIATLGAHILCPANEAVSITEMNEKILGYTALWNLLLQ